MATSTKTRIRLGNIRISTEPRTIALGIIGSCLILLAASYALTVGTLHIPLNQVWAAIRHDPELPSTYEKIIWTIRLPRVIGAIAVGAALGAAGCAFQSLSRNALGSPDIIGFTTGAATGAVAQIVFFDRGTAATALAAVGTGFLTAIIVYFLSRHNGTSGGYRLVLIGIGISALLGAANTMMLARGDLEMALRARLWLSGSLNARTWADVTPALIGAILLIPILMAFSRHLNVMEMGDPAAQQLGVRVEQVRIITMITAVALTAVTVSAAGPIAFIALAAPQIAGRLTQAARVQIGAASIIGALLLLLADILTQIIPAQVALPVGLITGLLGGIYLLLLLVRATRL